MAIIKTVSEWKSDLSELGSMDEPQVFGFILSQIKGYGIDTATNTLKEDSQNLLNAFVAWKEIPY